MFSFALDPIDLRALASRSSTAKTPSIGSRAAHFRTARRSDSIAFTFIPFPPVRRLIRRPRGAPPARFIIRLSLSPTAGVSKKVLRWAGHFDSQCKTINGRPPSDHNHLNPHLAKLAHHFLVDPAVRDHSMDMSDVPDQRQAPAPELGCVCNHRHFPGCSNHLRV